MIFTPPIGWAVGGQALFLDSFPNALFAFSFRKLRADYGGSAVRIRRSSDDAEQDIGFDGVDFDAAAAASFIGGGSGFIKTWYDQSGNGNDVTQSTGSNQPLYVAGGLNSLPTVDFTASSSQTLANTGIAVAGEDEASVFAVVSMDSASHEFGGAINLVGNSSGGADWDNQYGASILERAGTTEQVQASQNGGISGSPVGVTYSTPFRYAFNHPDDSTYDFYADTVAGSHQTSRTMTLGTSTVTLRIGARPGPSSYWDGQLSEVIGYLFAQTANLSAIDANQSGYWGF